MQPSVSSHAEEADRGLVKSLHKALAVLEAIGAADPPPRMAEVAIRVGIPRPSAYRIVQTLIADGYVIQDPQSGRLSVGFSVLMLAGSLLDRSRLRLEALPHLQSLSRLTGERTNLGILNQNKVLYLAGVEKPSLPTIYSRFGKSAPAHCCSLGKAILANLPERSVQALLAVEPLRPFTPHSITSMTRFLEELKLSRRLGYATDNKEHFANSCCVATAIFDGRSRVVGAIGVSGHELEPLLKHVPELRHTAEIISHVL